MMNNDHVRDAAGQFYTRRIAIQRRRGLSLDQAREVVHAGTVKALTTGSFPTTPTVAWFKAVDDSARLDGWRSEARASAAAGALAAFEVIQDRARRPAKGKGISIEADPNGDGADAKGSSAGPTYHAKVQDGKAEKPRYLPAPPPHLDTDHRLDDYLDRQHRVALAAEARATLKELADQAKIDADTMELVVARFGALQPVPWERVAKAAGARKELVRRRVQVALDALRAVAGDGVDVVNVVQRAHVMNGETTK